jgi:hypothetical protein
VAILTRAQVEKLSEIIEQHATWFAWRIYGKAAASQSQIDALKAKGLLPMDTTVQSVKYAYVLGKLEAVLKEGEYRNLTWAELQERARGHLSQIDHFQIEAAEMTTMTKFRGLTDDLKSGLFEGLAQATRKTITEAQVRGEIKDVIKTGVELSRSYQQVAMDLVERLRETNRNWTRVAATEMHSATQRGIVSAILQGEDIYEDADGENSLVAVVHDDDACDDCKSMYNDHDTGNPRIFRLKELLENEGTNYQRPWRQHAKPVVPPLHPHCYGRLTFVPPGWGWDHNGRFTMLDINVAHPELNES